MAEDVYQSALEVELGLRKIDFVAQAELDIYFKGHLLNAKYRPDLLVFGEVVVELKALKELCSDHEQHNCSITCELPANGLAISSTLERKANWNGNVLLSMISTLKRIMEVEVQKTNQL